MNIPPKYEDLVLKVAELERREAALLEELATLRESYESMRDRKNSIVELQQRLTVAEHRAADLKKLLCDVINEAATGFAALKVDLANRVNYALNPADHTQCEECKGWGYHENHHEGGGTECGECGGSGKAPVEQFSADTVVCRRYQIEQHPGQNFYHYDLEPVYGSVPVTVSDLITMVESAPVAVVMPERREPSPSNPHLSDADHEYNSALDDVARLNGVKP